MSVPREGHSGCQAVVDCFEADAGSTAGTRAHLGCLSAAQEVLCVTWSRCCCSDAPGLGATKYMRAIAAVRSDGMQGERVLLQLSHRTCQLSYWSISPKRCNHDVAGGRRAAFAVGTSTDDCSQSLKPIAGSTRPALHLAGSLVS